MGKIKSYVHRVYGATEGRAYHHAILSWVISRLQYTALLFDKDFSSREFEGKDALEAAIQTYYTHPKYATDVSINRLKKKLLFARLYYCISYSEYFVFGFDKLNEVGRRSYVGFWERNNVAIPTGGRSRLLRNKYDTYRRFQKYYLRELIQICGEGDRELCIAFMRKHRCVILKPVNAALGLGVQKIERESEDIDESTVEKILAAAPCILEECITQNQQLACFHPASVNTIRIATFRKDDLYMPMFALLRMGCGGSVVDNATTGGIVAKIDLKTGIVVSPGEREDGSSFIFHPDSGVQIIGTYIPAWEELLQLAEDLSREIPEQAYVGWDLAYSDQGWCMVEGNDNAMMTAIQMCQKAGIRELVDQTLLKK